MKRIALAALTVVLGLAALSLSLPFLVSADRIQQLIVARAQSISGKEISFSGSPQITFRPFLGVEVSNVVLRDPQTAPSDPPLLQVETLRGRIRVLPVLFGRIEIGSYQFIRPRFNLRTAQSGQTNWIARSGDLFETINAAKTRRENAVASGSATGPQPPVVAVGTVELVDGTVYYDDQASARRETLTNINGSFSWPDTRSALNFSGDFIWRGEAFETRLASGDALALFSGGASSLDARLISDAFVFEFAGEGNLISNLHLSGEGRIQAASLIRMAGLFGAPLPATGMLSEFSVSGKLETTPQKLVFSDATLEMDGNSGRGNLQLSFGKTLLPKIDGTIAAAQLDLTGYGVMLDSTVSAEGPGSPGSVSFLDIDLDLRMSAQLVRLGSVKINDVAATLSIRNNEALAEVGNAALMGGVLAGKMSLGRKAQNMELAMDARLDGFDMALVSASLPQGKFSLTGQGDAVLKAQSSGADSRKAYENLGGEFTLAAKNGTLSGVDFQQMLMLAQDVGSTGLQSSFNGETAFRELNATVAMARNIASIRSMRLANSKVVADIQGRAQLGDGGIALQVQLSPGPSVLPGPNTPAPVRLFVGGSHAAPLIARIQPVGEQR